MLSKISAQVSHCLERARHSRELADRAHDPETKSDFLEMERRWLRLAKSISSVERVSDFIAEASRSRSVNQLTDAEVEALAERMVDKPQRR